MLSGSNQDNLPNMKPTLKLIKETDMMSKKVNILRLNGHNSSLLDIFEMHSFMIYLRDQNMAENYLYKYAA